jgi:SAM-dependent methyltransferase
MKLLTKSLNTMAGLLRKTWGGSRRVAQRVHQVAHPGEAPLYRRYLSDRPRRRDAFLEGARTYVSQLTADNRDYLFLKPFDLTLGNTHFYIELYQVMNILQAMGLPGGRILEVGSGPGWVTELLLMCGFEVDAIEPSAEMIAIAAERVASCREHHRLKLPVRVAFHCLPLEDCTLPADSFDGVLFHESLHHVIDEDAGMAQCFRMLRPGGVVGVSGDGRWAPGARLCEELCEQEMARFGTLENPFTAEYVRYLFQKHGFEEITQYHGVNGLFPVEQGDRPVKVVAQFPATSYNTFTARKPGGGRTTANSLDGTRALIKVLESRLDAANRKLFLLVRLSNCGETTWLAQVQDRGFVTLALRQGALGSPGFREAEVRHRLPEKVAPGEAVTLDVVFFLPEDYADAVWHLDLVNEQLFWFSACGTDAVAVDLRGR